MKSPLAERHCAPCEGGTRPLKPDDVSERLRAVDAGWSLSGDGRLIERRFEFPAYSRTLAFANAVAWIAISEGHHPELLIDYSGCVVRWTTFAIGGLSENDFICAAKTDRLVSLA